MIIYKYHHMADEEVTQYFCKWSKHWVDEDKFEINPMTGQLFMACNDCRRQMKQSKQNKWHSIQSQANKPELEVEKKQEEVIKPVIEKEEEVKPEVKKKEEVKPEVDASFAKAKFQTINSLKHRSTSSKELSNEKKKEIKTEAEKKEEVNQTEINQTEAYPWKNFNVKDILNSDVDNTAITETIDQTQSFQPSNNNLLPLAIGALGIMLLQC